MSSLVVSHKTQINFSSCIIFSGHSLSNSRHIENILIFTKCANKSFECCCIEQVWTLKIDSGKWRIQNFSTQAMPGSPCRTLFFVTRTCCWLFFFPLGVCQDPKILFWKGGRYSQSISEIRGSWIWYFQHYFLVDIHIVCCKLTQALRLTSPGFSNILHDFSINSFRYCLQIM